MTTRAAYAFYVKRKTSRFKTAHARFGEFCKQITNVCKRAGVSGWVTSRRTANWGLINVDDFIDTVNLTRAGFPGGSALCPAGLFPGAPYFFCVQYQNINQARITGFEFEGMYYRG